MLQELEWQQVRAEVHRVNAPLAALIDELSPNKRYKLIKASYAFGDLMVKKGRVQLPTPQGLLPLTDSQLAQPQCHQLSYSTIPLALLLNKASEVFVGMGDEEARVIPLNILHPGKLFGTFETINYLFHQTAQPLWNVSAGARSIFMLPKITEASGFKRLRTRYGLFSGSRLKYLTDHWQVFSQLGHHPKFITDWQSEVLFFTKDWFSAKTSDKAWVKFYHYLFQQGWQQSHYAISKFEFGLFWQAFVKAIHKRHLKPSTYLSDTIKHLLAIAIGAAPAFRPSADETLAAPIRELQQIFIDTYALKDYFPTILYPAILDVAQPLSSVYYSLAFPTLLEGSPEAKSATTLMLDIKDIKLMLETLQDTLTMENNLIKAIDFHYFHVEEDKLGEIQSSKMIPQTDDAFRLPNNHPYKDRLFCATSSFWRGCIKLAVKKDAT